MMYGTFPATFKKALRPYITNQRVIDLGCGDCERADILLSLDPEAIVGVDLDPPCKTSILTIAKDFKEALPEIFSFKPTIAHLAWPINNECPGLVPILHHVPTVIYVGCNTDGTSCGNRDLFKHFITREILLHIPNRQNTLIVYGQPTQTPRSKVYEEIAALDQWNSPYKIYPYKKTGQMNARQG